MTAHLLIVLPIVIPFAVGIVTLLLRKKPQWQQWINLVGMVSLMAVAIQLLYVVHTQGIQATTLGDWPAPFGITFVADHLAAIMVLSGALMGVAVSIFGLGDMDKRRVAYGFYPFMNLLIGGVVGAYLTGDLFNLYVWFEVLLIASFVLMALGNTREQLTANIKYVAINLVSSLFFLGGVGLIYGITGSLNMAEVATLLAEIDSPALITTISMLFIVSFGIKSAIFPLYFWLPASYHTPPPTIIALFAGLLTKVGVYALIRVFTLFFTYDVGYTHTILLWVAGFTMVSGVLGAAVQNDFRRVLSFHIVSQIGYMIMGLALFTPVALVGAIFYIVHNQLAKTNLFLISGVANRLEGTFTLKKLGGLYAVYPGLAILFVISSFALAGFPPLTGFWGKLVLAIGALETQEYIILAVALAVGMMTMFSMAKIWMYGFMPGTESNREAGSTDEHTLLGLGNGTATEPYVKSVWVMYLPVVFIAALIVFVSVFFGTVYDVTEQAAIELLDPSLYIDAVLD